VGIAGHAAVLAEGMVVKAAVCEPRATSVSTEMASPEMATMVTAAMTSTMVTPTMATAAMTASGERYARHYGRENNDDNPDAGDKLVHDATPLSGPTKT
jgi:hypothetical protein